ncbi:MAG: hypothetical protein HY074_02475 [Deltaproteobacteria bacterium]|nr:hypothetical protein [Deltaproteobacteria bacterium]
MNTSSILLIASLTLALVASACAKKSLTPAQQQANLATLLGQSLAVAVPDNSYAARNQSGVRGVGPNVAALINNLIDPVAKGLKEMNVHLAQTLAEGARSNGSLLISDTGLNTSLTGTTDNVRLVISWTYASSGSTYFTAIQQMSGKGSDFNFGASAASAAFTAHYDIQAPGAAGSSGASGVSGPSGTSGASASSGAPSQTSVVSHLAVIHSTAGNLTFTQTFTDSLTVPSSVSIAGTVGGNAVNGSWSKTSGGYFRDVTGTMRCFDANLQDVFPCIH